MPADFDGLTCPRCGSGSLATEEGHRYCSYIGGDTGAPCSWGLGKHDRGSREADVAAWRKRRGIPEPCPAGHPAACITSSREGACSCAWCDEVAKLRAELADEANRANRILVEGVDRAAALDRRLRAHRAVLADCRLWVSEDAEAAQDAGDPALAQDAYALVARIDALDAEVSNA